jgi:hypothetical protein
MGFNFQKYSLNLELSMSYNFKHRPNISWKNQELTNIGYLFINLFTNKELINMGLVYINVV